MENDLKFSRPLAVADRLGELAIDRHRFINKQILLTGESEALWTANGRDCFIDSLLLLIRICKNVSIDLSSGLDDLIFEIRSIVDRINLDSNILFLKESPDLNRYDAILSIGARVQPGLPWTVINSNGWLASVSSGKTDLKSVFSLTNPISSLAAASLGVSEVFKRLLLVKEERGCFFDDLSFSLLTYKTGDSDPGPPLPELIQIESALLVGVGAIGNGIIHLFNQLPVQGRLTILDNQIFQKENLGTCLLIGQSQIGKEKALFAEALLKGKLAAKGYKDDLISFKTKFGRELPYPSVILNALDNIPARHASQDIWPDIIIDGAISDFGCQVSRHPWGKDIACLKCIFQEAPRSAEKSASSATGLTVDRIIEVSDVVNENDISIAPVEKRDWLKEHIGQQICSVIQEGIAQQISTEKQNASFEPSVPFVACLSASMVIAELIKSSAGWTSLLEPRFQFDVLQGPNHGQFFPQSRRRGCICVERGTNINRIKSQRA